MPTLFAEPRFVESLDDCIFYHTIDLPGFGTQPGMWDLRANVEKYLGQVDLQGKRVLEMGTATGYLCFHMESQGPMSSPLNSALMKYPISCLMLESIFLNAQLKWNPGLRKSGTLFGSLTRR